MMPRFSSSTWCARCSCRRLAISGERTGRVTTRYISLPRKRLVEGSTLVGISAICHLACQPEPYFIGCPGNTDERHNWKKLEGSTTSPAGSPLNLSSFHADLRPADRRPARAVEHQLSAQRPARQLADGRPFERRAAEIGRAHV